MQEKIPILVIYGLVGLLIALSPSLANRSQPVAGYVSRNDLYRLRDNLWSPILFIVVAILLLAFTRTLPNTPFLLLVVSFSIGAGFLHRQSIGSALQACAGNLLACTVSSTLPWWRRLQPGIDISNYEMLAFAIVLIFGSIVLLHHSTPDAKTGRSGRILALGLYSAIAGYFSFSLASLATPGVLLTLWHHWGAYIGPSELVQSGARLFHDIPAQYGAGPTFVLALACGADCWASAYWVVCVATFTFVLLIGAIAWSLRSRERYSDILLLLLCIVTCTFWIAYPPIVSAPNVTPSTSGLRFLPAVMLVAWILFTSDQKLVFRTALGHTLWVFGALWSPESAFYVSAIWWPVYVFDCTALDSSRARLLAFARAIGRILGLAAGTIVVASLCYRLWYGVFPIPRYLLAYMLYPPGPLPIDPHGTIWFFGFVMALSLGVSWTTWKSTGDSVRFRCSLTLQLLVFSTFSYYLGRSHDNNLLNLMPFFLLLLQDSFVCASGVFVRQAAAVALASLLAWLAVFGWQPWLDASQAGNLANFSFTSARAQFDYSNKNTAANLAKRMSASIQQIDQTSKLMDILNKRGEPFMVLDPFFVLQPKYPPRIWSAMNGPVNFAFIPSQMRREFLLQTARRLGRDGWLIVARNFDSNTWLADFDSVYDRTDRIDLDTCYAIRFTPRLTLELGPH
jgi:hypothetical protein